MYIKSYHSSTTSLQLCRVKQIHSLNTFSWEQDNVLLWQAGLANELVYHWDTYFAVSLVKWHCVRWWCVHREGKKEPESELQFHRFDCHHISMLLRCSWHAASLKKGHRLNFLFFWLFRMLRCPASLLWELTAGWSDSYLVLEGGVILCFRPQDLSV